MATNSGDEIGSGLLNELEQKIATNQQNINIRAPMAGFEGNVRAIAGTLAYDLTGAIDTGVDLLEFAGSIDLEDHDTLTQVAFRVKDNGVDEWACAVSVVGADGIAAAWGSRWAMAFAWAAWGSGVSLLTGAWETVIVTKTALPNTPVERFERYRIGCQTDNADGSSMLASGAEVSVS